VKRAALVAALALFVAGCMEVEQASTPAQQAGQTVKRDTAAWNNEPLANGPKWNKGDRNSWEEQIKKRQLSQNESVRIGN
jgi:PBP1b-binding outer membrane lipoprotein LpoB